jgi:hypothetical protein
MSEMRMNEVVLAGRTTSALVRQPDGAVHFLFEGDPTQKPFHCFADGTTADNLLKFCQLGDEFSLEGQLAWHQFGNEPHPKLLVKVRYVSFGRKLATLR